MNSPLRKIAIVIPAWQPDDRLVELTRSLAVLHFASIVIVNDGSGKDYEDVFDHARSTPSVVVLSHERNRGQGRAVKTALRFVADNLPDLAGAVTADADGQHAVDDIVRVAQCLSQGRNRIVLGSRAFGAGVPFRSRFGNILTQYVFAALSGFNISDTQSGLRGIPKQLIPEVLRVRGDRYEFATGLLAHFCNCGRPPLQVPIATIYIDRNRSSHFNPVRDSIRIYLLLIRCYASLFVPVCIDFAGFVLMYVASGSLAWAVLIGRIGAAAALLLQRHFGYAPLGSSAGKRIVSLAISGIAAFAGIWFLAQHMHCNFVAAKILLELVLWLALIPAKARMRWWCAEEEDL